MQYIYLFLVKALQRGNISKLNHKSAKVRLEMRDWLEKIMNFLLAGYLIVPWHGKNCFNSRLMCFRPIKQNAPKQIISKMLMPFLRSSNMEASNAKTQCMVQSKPIIIRF